ncbi:hypothetical protein BDZ89DRAFT_1061237, partial [Hymenopellis radicata]
AHNLVHATTSSLLPILILSHVVDASQSSRSAYPFTFYTDVTSPSVVYLICGRHLRNDLLNMDFDTIPLAARGLICVSVVTIDAMEEDGDGDGAFPRMERSLGVRWTECGEDVRSASMLSRFTMYDVDVMERVF